MRLVAGFRRDALGSSTAHDRLKERIRKRKEKRKSFKEERLEGRRWEGRVQVGKRGRSLNRHCNILHMLEFLDVQIKLFQTADVKQINQSFCLFQTTRIFI